MRIVLDVACVALSLAALLYLVWFFYLAVMSLARARQAGTLSNGARIMGLPILYLGLALDCLGNLTFAMLIFLDLPREPLVSSRLQRYVDGPPGWRRNLALVFARHLLDPFDPRGFHIRKPEAGQ